MPATSYRLATYETTADRTPRAGIVVDDQLLDVGPSVLDLLRSWRESAARLKQVAQSARRGDCASPPIQLARVRLLAPILYPGTIFAGANYKDHVLEMSKALNLPPEPDPHELGLKPWHFIKAAAQCVRGQAAGSLAGSITEVNWEAGDRRCSSAANARRCQHRSGAGSRCRPNDCQRSFRAGSPEALRYRRRIAIELDAVSEMLRRSAAARILDLSAGRGG